MAVAGTLLVVAVIVQQAVLRRTEAAAPPAAPSDPAFLDPEEVDPVHLSQVLDPGQLDPVVARAIATAEERVRREPASGSAHGELGRVYHAHKHVAQARRSYQQAQRLDAETADWPYYLGLFAAEDGKSEAAVAYFERTLRARPDYLPAWFHLGSASLTLDRVEEAERAFGRMVELAPADPWGHFGLGLVARRRQHWQRAAAALELAGRAHREAVYLLAMTRRELGDTAGAQRLLAELPREASVMPDPLLQAALAQRADLERLIQQANRLVAAGDPSGAESLYRAVAASNPQHYDAHYNLGLLLARAGRHAEAEGMLLRAVRLREDSAPALFLLAMTSISLGKVEQGRAHVRRALAIDPRHELALDLARQLERDGG